MIKRNAACHLRVRGSGTLAITKYGLDNVTTKALTSVTLATSPGVEVFRRGEMINEGCAYNFSTNAADSYFILSMVRHYARDFSPQR